MELKRIKEKIVKLRSKEKQELISYLRDSYTIFSEYSEVTACKYCNSSHIVKNGTRADGSHKYICRACKRNFTFRTNTVLSGIQKLSKWNLFVEDFMSLNISPLKEIQERLGISRQTAFNWRHKLIAALVNKDPKKFSDENVEFDDVYFLISRKGRQNLGIVDKHKYKHWRRTLQGDHAYSTKVFFTYGRDSKTLDLHLANMGKVSKAHLEKYFTNDKFKNVSVFSDKDMVFRGFFRDQNIPHQDFRAREHISFINKSVHNQHLNRFANDFRSFTNGYMRGVSTKYLSNYLKWYTFIYDAKLAVKRQIAANNKKIKFDVADKICKDVVSDNKGLGTFRKLEVNFGEFLKENGRSNFGKCRNHYYGRKVA